MEGTYMFMPPESCSFDIDKYSMKKADIWALGITIYIMVFNDFPFELGKTEIDVMENICNFQLEFKNRKISSELKQMLSMFLEKDPAKRASLEQLKNCAFIKNEQEMDIELLLSCQTSPMSSDFQPELLTLSCELSLDITDSLFSSSCEMLTFDNET